MIIQHPTREAWLRDRLSGIGGSDAPAVLGHSKYGSPWSVWQSRVYPLESFDAPSPGTPADFGLRFERAIADVACDILGAKLEDLRESGSFCASVVVDDARYLRATPDYFGRGLDRFLLQVKNVDLSKADEWRDELAPIEYEIQLQHELLAAQSLPDPPAYGVLAACLGGNRCVLRRREIDVGFLERWIDDAAAFWRLVETKTPPRIDGHRATKEAALRLHEARRGETIAVLSPDEWADLFRERARLDEELAATRERMNEIDTRAIVAMGANTIGTIPGIGRAQIITVAESSHVRWYDNPLPKRMKKR